MYTVRQARQDLEKGVDVTSENCYKMVEMSKVSNGY